MGCHWPCSFPWHLGVIWYTCDLSKSTIFISFYSYDSSPLKLSIDIVRDNLLKVASVYKDYIATSDADNIGMCGKLQMCFLKSNLTNCILGPTEIKLTWLSSSVSMLLSQRLFCGSWMIAFIVSDQSQGRILLVKP